MAEKLSDADFEKLQSDKAVADADFSAVEIEYHAALDEAKKMREAFEKVRERWTIAHRNQDALAVKIHEQKLLRG